MKQIDKILIVCGKNETSLKDIADMLGWTKGATSVAINQLIDSGLLTKIRYGFYGATAKGRKEIMVILEEQQEFRDEIGSVVQWTAAEFTADSRFDILRTLKYGREGIRPSRHTKLLAEIFEDIYLDTISPAHRDDYDLAKSMWRNHNRPTCTSCRFDFEKAYQTHATRLDAVAKKIHHTDEIDKKNLFRKLRWYSFPDSERTRKNFGWKTKYTEPKIPSKWDD